MEKGEAKNKTKAVLFDMDGVLFLSINAWFHNFNYSMKKYGNKPLKFKRFTSEVIDRGGTLPGVIKKFFPDVNYNEFASSYFKNFSRFIKNVNPNRDAKKTIEKLNSKGLKICVVTNTYRKSAVMLLKENGMFSQIDLLVAGDEVKNLKPAPDGILKACRMAKIKPDDAIYVGDAKSDAIAARRAKIRFVGYRREGDFKINKLTEILNLTHNL